MKNVLVVDDEVEIVNSLKEYLSEKGFNVLTCHAADEAFSCYQKNNPDLILSDIKMPGRSGIELFKLCNESPVEQQVPFVLMTSYSDIIGVEKAFSMGVSELIAKPFDLESLNLVLNYLLELENSIGSSLDKYFSVPIEEFISSRNCDFDIYLRVVDKYVLVTRTGQEFSEQRLQNFMRRGATHIYLSSDDFARYTDLQFAIAKTINKRPLDLARKTKVMGHLMTSVGQSLILQKVDKSVFNNSLNAFEAYTQVALNNSQLSTVLDQLNLASPSIIEKAATRAMLSSMVTGLWKWSSPKFQSRIMLASLLCDIGLKDQSDILKKKLFELSTQEKQTYEQHPVESYRILSQITDIPEEITTVALQHHENSAGLGFPQKTARNKLHSFSVIVHCIDEFLEVMFTHGGGDPAKIQHCLDFLLKNQGKMLNQQVVKSLYMVFNLRMPRELEGLLLPNQTSRLN